MPLRPGRAFSLAPVFLMASSLVAAAPSAAPAHGFEVLLHYRLPDGAEETLRLEDFHFIYYERRFVNKSTGFGKPGKVEIRDLPHDLTSIQNDQGKKLKFKHLQSVHFEYQGEKGNRRLVLMASFRNTKKSVVTWLVSDLRNTHVARLPHFRGETDGKKVDVPIPSLVESDTPQEKSLTALEFQFPGQKKHRDWF
jgi:hypothetical protein